MRNKRYSCIYNNVEYFVMAICEEQAFFACLKKAGIKNAESSSYEEISNHKMEIVLVR